GYGTNTASVWTYTTSTLPAGTHTVQAVYTGVGGFAAGNATLAGGQVVKKANATVVVTPYTATYNGAARTAAVASITGVSGQTGAAVGAAKPSTPPPPTRGHPK